MMADMRPSELWTVRTQDGRRVRATLVPRGREVTLVWSIDERPEGAEDFADWAEAMRRADMLRLAFLSRQES